MNLKLDSTGDIIIGRSMARTSGVEYVAQLVRNRLLTLLGEWEQDTSLGLPWLQGQMLQPRNISLTEGMIRDVILGTSGVRTLVSLSITSDTKVRKVYINFVAKSVHGNISSSVDRSMSQ